MRVRADLATHPAVFLPLQRALPRVLRFRLPHQHWRRRVAGSPPPTLFLCRFCAPPALGRYTHLYPSRSLRAVAAAATGFHPSARVLRLAYRAADTACSAVPSRRAWRCLFAIVAHTACTAGRYHPAPIAFTTVVHRRQFVRLSRQQRGCRVLPRHGYSPGSRACFLCRAGTAGRRLRDNAPAARVAMPN